MGARKRSDAKIKALSRHGTLNPRAEEVRDPLFEDSEFFDPRDLVQVRYEMLRAVRDGRPVKEAASRFGCSRPTYYKAQADFEREGLGGLVPRKRGPRGGHKLTDQVLDFVEQSLEEDSSIPGLDLAEQVLERFGVRVHASSIRRAVERRRKRGRQ